MHTHLKHLAAVVFDWAGTTVDHGSRAPASVFQEIFRRRDVPITSAQAREPMGMAKREHISAILAMPAVATLWEAIHRRAAEEADIDALYHEFLPLQKSILKEYSHVIAGVPAAVDDCRRLGLKIGSTTGYTRELMQIVTKVAKDEGYQPDCVLCAEDAPRGRPAPYLLFEAAKQLDVYPLWRVVNVDDTPVGIEAGRNAGCWSVGITRTGNCVGLSAEEFAALSGAEQLRQCEVAARQLRAAGADYTIESVTKIVPVLLDIDRRMAQGESPVRV